MKKISKIINWIKTHKFITIITICAIILCIIFASVGLKKLMSIITGIWLFCIVGDTKTKNKYEKKSEEIDEKYEKKFKERRNNVQKEKERINNLSDNDLANEVNDFFRDRNNK